MKNKELLISMLLVSCIAAENHASTLTPEEALGRIENNQLFKSLKKKSARNPVLSYTISGNDAESTPLIYIFNKGDENGFILTAADDSFAPLLGISDNGDFDIDKAPENFKWLLKTYSEEIEYWLDYSKKTGMSLPVYSSETAGEFNKYTISPLVTTKWNQDAPYYDLCPMKNGKRSVTGCVATAMAQVVNYHKYPEKGKGTHSYDWEGTRLTFDYDANPFDWDNMLDTYTYTNGKPNFTDKQGLAAANLMLACGIGVNMGYDPEASGAYSENVPNALINYFGFDRSATMLPRDYFSDEQWDKVIFSELEAGRPVYYAGNDGTAGHAFVCDGCRGDDFYHINWGWGGSSDGYYRLDSLLPNSQGIGGGSGNAGFTRNQRAGVGIRKPGSSDAIAPWIVANGNFKMQNEEGYVACTFDEGFFNFSNFDAEAIPGVKMVSSDNEEIYISVGEELSFPMPDGQLHGYRGFAVNYDFESLEPGRYKLYPVVQSNGEWNDIYVKNGYSKFVILAVGLDKTYSFITPPAEGMPEIQVTELSGKAIKASGIVTMRFTVTYKNIGKVLYSGDINLTVYSKYSGKPVAQNSLNISIEPGATATQNLSVKWDRTQFGIFEGIITDQYGALISNKAEIEYGTIIESITLPKITLDGIGKSETIIPDILPKNASLKDLEWTSSDPDIVEVENGVVTSKALGEATVTALAKDGSGVKGQSEVIVNMPTGISEIIAENEIIDSVFDVSGLKILESVPASKLKELPKGLYIVKTATKVIKVRL